MKCIKGYEVEALRSNRGWYLGTCGYGEDGSDDIGPRCRISNEYAPTSKEAEKLLLNRQHADENCLCNGGRGCFAVNTFEFQMSTMRIGEPNESWRVIIPVLGVGTPIEFDYDLEQFGLSIKSCKKVGDNEYKGIAMYDECIGEEVYYFCRG